MKKEDFLTENQRKIYEIARNYLQKKPNFTINDLLSVCSKESWLSDEEILKILNRFIKKKVIVPGSRLTRETVLKNETRNNLYQFISENPGYNITRILTHFKVGPYTGRWHLEILKKFGFIKEVKFSIYKIFYHINFPKDKEILVFLIRNKNSFHIYLSLINNTLNPTQLSKILNLHYTTIQFHLKKMLQSKLVIEIDYNTFSVNTDFLSFLGQYYDLNVPLELSQKISKHIEVKKPIILPVKEEIKVLREFDYFGGNIRYKVAVQNNTKMTISKIDVIVRATSQYIADEKVKAVDYLVPGETRGVDFILTPLTCGKSQVYSTVTYTDGIGNPQTVLVKAKEIWIKCPLVSPKKVMSNQIEEWKKALQKGSSIIQFESLSPQQVFELAHNQISALDLAEIIYDDKNNMCIFSGIAKVTSTKMMVEVNITSNKLVLDVWADNMKQATGFIAYIRNLINLAIKNAQQMKGKIEQLGHKILNIFEISNRLIQLFDFCEKLWILSEILIILKEIHSRLDHIFPDLVIIDEISNWIENLESSFKVGDSIREKESSELQSIVQSWLSQIIRLVKSNIEVFNETFRQEKDQIEYFASSLHEMETNNQRFIEKIIKKILMYAIIIQKNSGLTLYSENFQEAIANPDLWSGFITAIQGFGSEISQVTTHVKKIEYQGFEINLEDGQWIRVALILKGIGPEIIRKNLNTFMKEYERKFNTHLQEFTGEVSVFKNSQGLIEKYFLERPYEDKAVKL